MTTTIDPPTPPSPPVPPPPPVRPRDGSSAVLAGRPGRVLVLLFGGVLTLALLAFGVFNIVMVVAHEETSAPVSFPQTIRHVRVDLGSGDVTLVGAGSGGGERTGVTGTRTVTRGLTEPTFSERVDGDTLVVEASCRAVFSWCSVSYSLSVPASVTVDIESSSGDVVVQSVTGKVTVRSSSGDIQADGVDAVDARARSGDITVTGASGPVVLTTSSGDVTGNALGGETSDVEVASGDVQLSFRTDPMLVDARASSGDVTIIVPSGEAFYRVTTQTSSGSENIAVRRDPAGERRLVATTSSGDIVISQTGSR